MDVTRERETGLPAALRALPFGVTRPKALTGTYANPRAQTARLVRRGLLTPLAAGNYAIPPRAYVGRPWRPTIEAAAVGIAAAKVGLDAAVLAGLSAARLHGAVPRAIGVAVVAVPRQMRAVTIPGVGRAVFTVADTAAMAAELRPTELGDALVATVEQTVLDLAHGPALGGLPAVAAEAIRALLPRCDHQELARLAATQRRGRALARLRRDYGRHRA